MRHLQPLARPSAPSAPPALLRALVVGAPLGLAACGESFTSDDAGTSTCEAPSCEGAGSSCRSYDFESECPSDWELTGNFDLGAVGECRQGKVVLAADGTLDVYATLSLESPQLSYAMNVSTRLSFMKWDGERMFALGYGQQDLFRLDGVVTPEGNSRYSLCRDDECAGTFECPKGEEHLFQFDLSGEGFAASVDCQPLGSLPDIELPTTTWLWLELGKRDAHPIEGTLDDVVISFREP